MKLTRNSYRPTEKIMKNFETKSSLRHLNYLLVDRTECHRCRRRLIPLRCIHSCTAKKKKHETRQSVQESKKQTPISNAEKGGKLRCGAAAAVDATGPPSEVSMAATPPAPFLALFFLFRFFAMAAPPARPSLLRRC